VTDSTRLHALLDRSLGDLVTERAQTAIVFERFGLDYCCHGRQTLADAARQRGVPTDALLDALGGLPDDDNDGEAPATADLDELTRYIIAHHHGYIRSTTPMLTTWLDKLVDRHGGSHPELVNVRATFHRLADELFMHMGKEENILFPYIDAMAASKRAGGSVPRGPFGTVANPVRVMEDDHTLAGELAEELRVVTHGFTAPEDGCRTYRLCYDELSRFVLDLHRHVHLENHVLFPRAIALEQALV
jgi:regulator of cell morphogenesis and NO signaling